MSYENPTRLHIGMHGDFAGKDFRLIGRVVMGVTINDETYYWNEFNLQTNTGETATLVYEDTERGGDWRLFTEFEPDSPLTAADAVLKQVGDELSLTGVTVRVTLVQTSRVYRIEGTPPAGECVGDEDNYFNAEAGDVMQVVSWTGQKIEYYNGFTLAPGSVDTAFRLPRQAPARIFSGGSGTRDYASFGKYILWGFLLLFILVPILARNFSFSTSYEAPPVKKVSAPSPPLMVGASEEWNGQKFHITAHAVMEVAGVNSVYERNEYELTDDASNITLLVCGEKPDAKEWRLYTPLSPLEAPLPQQAVNQKFGDTVNIDGVTATISELSQFTVKSMDAVADSNWHQGDVRFGYTASSQYDSLLVRWDKQNITFLRGKKVPPKDFIAAISSGTSP
ncbi:MAG TPA: hypothetical protein VG347_13065 [Verrucomicrobiae bacterium]|nr:hypothetical protein [Verrucomicrobiae bacterium]